MGVARGGDDRQAHEAAVSDAFAGERVDAAGGAVFGGLYLDLTDRG
jgi:hypothetical protein